jgi:hypothetical protein
MACCDTENTTNRCTNPCTVTTSNTPACESLPSQIENFTTQFFGTVVKTEVDGAVRWTLPCNLETGLENNPRIDNEGLACYFLRLFDEGITGATGPAGPAGANGANGNNAYSVTLASFTQPTLSSPTLVIQISANPVFVVGLYIFIENSGWYLITNTDSLGNLWVTLSRPLSGVTGQVTAGKLVTPSGYPGESVTGATGPQGPKGDTGTAGTAWTETNTQTAYPLGTDYNTQVAYQIVDLVSGTVAVLLPDRGTYLLNCTVGVTARAAPNDPALADVLTVKLRDTSNNADVPMTELEKNNYVASQVDQIQISVFYTTDGPTKTVALFAKCSSADKIQIDPTRTVINAVRIA